MSRAIDKAIGDVISAADRLYRSSRRKDAKLAAMLITAVAESVRAGAIDEATLREMVCVLIGRVAVDARR